MFNISSSLFRLLEGTCKETKFVFKCLKLNLEPPVVWSTYLSNIQSITAIDVKKINDSGSYSDSYGSNESDSERDSDSDSESFKENENGSDSNKDKNSYSFIQNDNESDDDNDNDRYCGSDRKRGSDMDSDRDSDRDSDGDSNTVSDEVKNVYSAHAAYTDTPKAIKPKTLYCVHIVHANSFKALDTYTTL